MNSERKPLALIGVALLAFSACAAPIPVPATAPTGAGAISPEGIHARVAFLASDSLRGRDTPSEGLEAAAAYIVAEHRRLGLEPGGEGGTYYQRYPYGLRSMRLEGVRLRIAGVRQEDLVLGRDFYAAGATAEPLEGALVFLGRELPVTAQGGTLRERIAVAALPGDGLSREFRQLSRQQMERARRDGAAAVIQILDPSWAEGRLEAAARAAGEPRRVLGDVGFPQIFLSYPAARRLFAAANLDLDALWARSREGSLDPVTLAGIHVAAELPVRHVDEARPPNVVAVLRGSDPVLREEYVVLSAHMDHVGVGRPVDGDSIYNGADDNASGTAGLLEIARAFASLPDRPRRSIIFLHVSGEEKGLLGSRWYSDNPTVPLERIVANINVDMISRNSPDSVVVIGKDFSSLGALVNRVNARHPELGLVAADDIWPEENFFFRSDHFNFARREIPAIFFFTGVHEDYHRPSDSVDRIDFDKAARVARLIFHVTREIADDPQRPTWIPAGLEQVRALTR